MKKLLVLCVTVIAFLLWPLFRADSGRRTEPQANVGETVENVAAREAFRMSQLQDENGYLPPDGWSKAIKEKEHMPVIYEAWQEFWDTNSPAPGPLPWVSIGPGNIGGRVRSLIINPASPNTIWAGAVSGGIWKSLDGGASWATNTDNLGNINVSCMVIDPLNSNVLYSGTGGETLRGNGIFKTDDGGKKWVPLASTQFDPDFYGVNRLAISPDSSTLLTGTYTGIFRSTNGGSNWQKATGASGDIFDVHFHPTNPQKAIASGRLGQIYYSENGGLSWKRSAWAIRPPGSGTIKVAYAKSNPSVVYANTLSEQSAGQLYRSGDGGRSFIPTGNCCTGVLWWANCLWIDPTNPNTVIFGGGTIYRSFDAGVTKAFVYSHHPDHQVIVEHPEYDGITNRTVFVGTDGGINRTDDILRNPDPPPPFGESLVKWANLNHGLGITQFHGAAGNEASGVIIGGTQDNGSIRYQPETGNWTTLTWGDGGYCASDQTDPLYFYMEAPWLSIVRSTDGGKSVHWISRNMPHNCNGVACANFTAPFVLDPNNPNWLLAGGNVLWKSPNVKEPDPDRIGWVEIKPVTSTASFISAIAVMEGNSDVIWVGHLDGSVYYTTNGTAATPTWTQVSGLPQRYCSSITIASGNEVFVTFGGFTAGNVWRGNAGNWMDVSSNLPDAPVYCLVVSRTNPNIWYVGTETGVYASGDQGLSWSPGNRGPADVAVFTLFWLGNDLIASTYGRGMFRVGPAIH